MEAYDELRDRVVGRLATAERGDPQATAEAILQIVDAQDPPLRFAVGAGVLPLIRDAFADRLAAWESWESVSNAAQGGR